MVLEEIHIKWAQLAQNRLKWHTIVKLSVP